MAENRQKKQKPRLQIGTLRRVLIFIGRYRILLALSLLLAVASVALTLYIPILVGNAIDLIVKKGDVQLQAILRILIKIGVVAGVTALLQWLMTAFNNRMTFQVVRDIRNAAFQKIEILPLQYIDAHAYGEVVSRVMTDVDQFADGLLMGFAQLFTGVVTILGTLAFMLAIDWRISLVVILLTPVSLVTARLIAQKTYHLFRAQSQVRAEQTALLDEMIKNQKVVLAYSHEAEAMARFDEINERLADRSLKATFLSSISNPTTRFINTLVYAGVGLIGALTSIATGGVFSVGQLSVFLSYANQYTRPFNEISGVATELQNALACAARVFELIDEQPQIPDAADAKTLEHIEGNLSVQDVAFSYSPERPLIRDLSFCVKPGQRIAIVGPTGCGKTTIINLLMRFYDVNAGEISVDGQDVRALTRKSLRAGYGMVLQETWLKTGTIMENLTIGKPDASQAEVESAAKAAHAHNFIMRLPKGYDTEIGEDGGSLSQGQKQLLCIARVMLCLPPMLILDEATSSVDTRTEGKIQEAFKLLMEGRTSIVVAHRLSTIRQADWILVMNNGNVIEQGRHEALLAQGGFYAHLYNSQFVAS